MKKATDFMEQVEFDLTAATARQIHETGAVPKIRKGRLGATAQLFPLIVIRCPAEWGAPDDEATYARLPLIDVIKPLFQAYNDAAKDIKSPFAGVSFDLGQITPPEYDELVDNAAANDFSALAAMLAKLVKACPGLDGDLHDPDTYLDLPYYTHFLPLCNKMVSAGKDLLENFLKPSTGT